MGKKSGIYWLLAGVATAFFILPSLAVAADKTVYIPIIGKAVEPPSTFTNSIGMQFRLIPSGSFVMGSPDGTGDTTHRPVWPIESGRESDELQHVVTLSQPFYMQTTEVTQGQWHQVMGSNPANFTACGLDCPVERVSWNEVQNFINALNASENRTSCNTSPNNCYALPSESQWEYAARAGTVTAFYNGGITNTGCSPLDPNLDQIGWYCGNANNTTHPVARKEPNNWGLFDMSGNVWEWCQDWFGSYPDDPETDPTGPATGSGRVVRGGNWNSNFYARDARSASRGLVVPGDLGSGLGFRLVLPGQ